MNQLINRLWLVIWTLNNIGVTLLNKAAFQSVDFNYPYFLSAVHMICNSAGSQLIFWSLERARASGDKAAVEANPVTQLLGAIQRQTLDAKGQRLILAFSVIFSLNIAIGNVSLKYVSVNFNQVRLVCCRCLASAEARRLGWRFCMQSRLVATLCKQSRRLTF